VSDGAAAKNNKILSPGRLSALVGYSFILPNFIGFFIFILIPVGFSFVLSVMKWDGFNEMTFIGLDNFKAIVAQSAFRGSLSRTLVFTAVTVAVTTFAALGLAVLLNKKIPLKGFFRSSIFFPYIASMVSIAVVWRLMFMRDFGPINEFLRFIGISDPPGWIATTRWALPAVMIVYVWKFMGYYMVVYLAALQDIPAELFEAASIDGASRFQFFWRVEFPMLKHATFFVVMMLTINSFKTFDLIFAMTEGGPGQSTTLLSNYIYNRAFLAFDYGQTSAAALVLFAIVAAATIFQLRLEKKIS